MAKQERVQQQSKKRTEETTETTESIQSKSEKLKQDIDDILDEIEGVLEVAKEFTEQFIQKGGQIVRVLLGSRRFGL